MAFEKNLYEILDIQKNANQSDLLHAYNRLKEAHHKDSLATYSILDEESKSALLEEIEYAYSVLGNPSKRKEYDEHKLKNLASGYTSESTKLNLHGIPKEKQSFQQETCSAPLHNAEKETTFKVKKEPAFQKEIESCQNLNGEFLRLVRVYCGYSEVELAEICNLKLKNIQAIENEDPEILPHKTYLRGHLMLMCQALEIPNSRELIGGFLTRLCEEEKLQSQIL